MTAPDNHDDRDVDMTPGDESNHITDHAKQDEIRRLLRGEEETSAIGKPSAEGKATANGKKRIIIRKPGAKGAAKSKEPYNEPANPSPKKKQPAVKAEPKRDDVSISEPGESSNSKSRQVTSSGKAPRRKRISKKEQPISVMGFSASGKTVFLSMLYHATAESNKFHDHWKARWNDDETRTYLRDLGRSILGVKATGSPDWQDGSHTKVKRRFPTGTDEGKELLFSMSRSWCLKDFNTSYRTMDGSGEIIHRHFYVKPDEKTPRDHEKWDELSGLCRESKAVMLFINVMGLDVTHDTGEVRMMVEWLMHLKRPPKVVSVVVPGCDTISSEKEVLEKKKHIEEKYKPAFDMLDEHDVPYQIFMVSSLGNKMTRKKASLDGLPTYCKKPGHICQYCQELVDDPSVMPHPDGLHKPFEFIFKQLLPWYYRWAPIGIAVSILTRIRRFFFNRVTAVLFLIALGSAYWFGRSYAHDWMIAEKVKITPSIDPDQMVQCKDLYSTLYSWDTNGCDRLEVAFEYVEMYNSLEKKVNSNTIDADEKVAEANEAVKSISDSQWKKRAKLLLEKAEDLQVIDLIKKQKSFRAQVEVMKDEITPDSSPVIISYAEDLLHKTAEYLKKEVKDLKKRKDTHKAETVIDDAESIIKSVDSWDIPTEDKSTFIEESKTLRDDVVAFKEKVEKDRFWEEVSGLISAANFKDASTRLDTMISSHDTPRDTQKFNSYRDITDIGMKVLSAQGSGKWDEALEFCSALKEFEPAEAARSAGILTLSTKQMQYDDNVARYDKVMVTVRAEEMKDMSKNEWARVQNLEHRARATASKKPSVRGYESASSDIKAATELLSESWSQLTQKTEEMQNSKKAYTKIEQTVDKQYLVDMFPVEWNRIQETIRSISKVTDSIGEYNDRGVKAYEDASTMLKSLWSKARSPQLVSEVTTTSEKLNPFSAGGSKVVQFAVKASPGAKVSFLLSNGGRKHVELHTTKVKNDRYLHVCDWKPGYLSDIKKLGKECKGENVHELNYKIICRIINGDDGAEGITEKSYSLGVICTAPKGYELKDNPSKPSFLEKYPRETSIPLNDKHHIFSILSYPILGLPRDGIDAAFGLIDKIPYISIPISTAYALPGRLLCKPWWRDYYTKFSDQSAGFLAPSEWSDQEWELFENARTWYWDDNPSMILVAPLYLGLGLPRDVIDMLFAGIDQVPYIGMPISYAYYPMTTVTKPWYAGWGYTVGEKKGRQRVPYCRQSKQVIGITEWWDESEWVFFENLTTGKYKSKNYAKQSKMKRKWQDLMNKYTSECAEAERFNVSANEAVTMKLRLGQEAL